MSETRIMDIIELVDKSSRVINLKTLEFRVRVLVVVRVCHRVWVRVTVGTRVMVWGRVSRKEGRKGVTSNRPRQAL